jgi:tetratricopeptide (TPR) repeat protein
VRRMVYYGNCQMGILGDLYRQFVAPSTGDVVSWINPYDAPLSSVDCATIASADIIVGQVHKQKSFIGLAGLSTRAQRHLIPTVNASFLWPFSGHPHTKHFQFAPYADMGDSFLNRMIKLSVPADEAIRRYQDLDCNKTINLDRLLEINLDEQRRRDELTDYRFADLIADRFRDEHLFLTPYHPSVSFVRYWAAEVMRRLDVTEGVIELMVRQLFKARLPWEARPIHHSVIRHFGLRFVTEESRYRTVNGDSLTFSEYAERYMQFEWNKELDNGMALWRAGRQEEAVEKMLAGLQQAPTSVDGLQHLTDKLARMKRSSEAVAITRHAVALAPNQPRLHDKLAAALTADGDVAGAEASSRRAVALAPHAGALRLRLSRILAAQNRLAEAEVEARAAVALDPLARDNQAHLGNMLLRMARLPEAEVALRQVVELPPHHSGTYIMLSRVLLRQGKFEDAVEAARVAVDLASGSADAYIQLSVSLDGSGRTNDAVLEVQRGIKEAPQAVRLHLVLSRLLERQGRADDAVVTIRHAISLDPASAEIWGHLVNLLERLVRPAEAEEALRHAIAAAPEAATLHYRLSYFLERRGDLDGSLQSVSRALNLRPEGAQLHLRHSQLLDRRGEFERALEAAQRALSLNPREASFHAQIGHLMARVKRFDEAEAALERGLALAPERQGIRQALERMRMRMRRTTPVKTDHGTGGRLHAVAAGCGRVGV